MSSGEPYTVTRVRFLALCRTSMQRFRLDREGRVRRGTWLDNDHVKEHMAMDGHAKLLCLFPEASDSTGRSLCTTVWEIPLKTGGVAIGRLAAFTSRVFSQVEDTDG